MASASLIAYEKAPKLGTNSYRTLAREKLRRVLEKIFQGWDVKWEMEETMTKSYGRMFWSAGRFKGWAFALFPTIRLSKGTCRVGSGTVRKGKSNWK